MLLELYQIQLTLAAHLALTCRFFVIFDGLARSLFSLMFSFFNETLQDLISTFVGFYPSSFSFLFSPFDKS